MQRIAFLLILSLSQAAWAESPRQFVDSYTAEAGRTQPGFAADAARGRAFAAKNGGVSEKLTSCTACHTGNPRNPGRHVVTGKAIEPLSPVVTVERFSDPAKVEKWFKRNCKEVVGRLCTPAEKADFIQYVMGAS